MKSPSRLAALLVAVVPAVAVAQNPQQEAKVLVKKAQKAHDAGDFPAALANLEAAFDKDPQPELLYAIAQVHVKLGQCTEAIGFYEQYLATNPPAAAANDTREAIAVCTAQLAPAPAPAPPPVTAPPPAAIAAPRLPWYRDALGAGLVGGGVVAAAVGVVVYASARGDLDAAERAADHAAYTDLVDSAHGKRLASVLLVGGGVVLVGVGVTRIVLKQPAERALVTVVPVERGGVVTWSGAW